jgi:hypothetical protein
MKPRCARGTTGAAANDVVSSPIFLQPDFGASVANFPVLIAAVADYLAETRMTAGKPRLTSSSNLDD